MGFIYAYRSGLKVWVLLIQDTFRPPPVISAAVSIYLIISTTVPQIPVLMLHAEFGMTSVPKLIFFFPISTDGKKVPLPFWVLANHLASTFFLPLSGDSLGLLYVPVPHSLPIRSQSTNTCWFPFWPGFVTWGIDLNSSFNGQSLAC